MQSAITGITYGPVPSRRLGRSLGINILPTKKKICNMNCIFCNLGVTPSFNISTEDFPSVEEVLSSLKKALLKITEPIDFLTISGNGEPTLHPNFKEIVIGVMDLKNLISPNLSTALLTNSSTAFNPDVKYGLSFFDELIMKLDAGNMEVFRSFNRPDSALNYDSIISFLKNMDNLTIQSLFAAGKNGNYTEENIEEWIQKIDEISPTYIQIYSLFEDYMELKKVGKEGLLTSQALLKNRNIACKVY
jgi:wyosine [tRNA(Phe)-imidazoG37] synthetase (radical SAM superfamily)